MTDLFAPYRQRAVGLGDYIVFRVYQNGRIMAAMRPENAYQEVLSLLPEKVVSNVTESLYSGEYNRKEVEQMVALAERIHQVSFLFGSKRLHDTSRKLAKKIEDLNDFLLLHYSTIGPGQILFQLYPESKHAKSLTTAGGEKSSWDALRKQGHKLAKSVQAQYEQLIRQYQNTKPQEVKKSPKIPAGTRWEDFIFTLLDDDSFAVHVRGIEMTVTAGKMGMLDGRTGKPKIQWELLKLFARNDGEIPATSPDARDNYKKQKQLLSQSLQQYFSIDFDPFEPYEGAYKTKFTIFRREK